MFFDDFYDSRAGDRTCGTQRNRLFDLRRFRNTKSLQRRRRIVLFQLIDQMLQRQLSAIFCAGDARSRQQIGVAAAVRGDFTQQIVISIRRTDKDWRHVVLHRCFAERRRLFHRHVGHQNGIDTHFRTAGIKTVNAVGEYQVGVHQQADWQIGILLPYCGQHLEAARWRGAGSEGAQRGILNGWAISQRIGEGNAQLQRIGTACDQRVDNLQRQYRRGIAEGNKGHKGAFLAFGKAVKQLLITLHQISPCAVRMS